jgi:hypothetical protein
MTFTVGELVRLKTNADKLYKIFGIIDGEPIGTASQRDPKMLIIKPLGKNEILERSPGNSHFPTNLFEKVTIH